MASSKRKPAPADAFEEGSTKRRFVEAEIPHSERNEETAKPTASQAAQTNDTPEEEDAATDLPSTTSDPDPLPTPSSAAADRLMRFKALQARQAASRKQNMKDSQAESRRQAIDPSALHSLQRKHAVAAHKLLKAETADAGEDFERKRAWDWTIEESEKWDERMARKEGNRRDVAFQDYSQDARKVYDRTVKAVKPDLIAYQASKMAMIEEATRSGGLDIVETETGELIAVDKDGTHISTADFVTLNAASSEPTIQNNKKPSKEAIDRLVGEIKKADAERLEKRRKRLKEQGKEEDGGDVTYINVKNKQFNEKLKRFYDKYTGDIRESFERGTAI